MISSLSGIAAKAGDSAYSASKFAIEGLTEAMRHEVARWNIKTALVEPGQYATNMFRVTEAGELGYCTAESAYYSLIKSQQEQLRNHLPSGRNPKILGDLLVEISRSDGRRFRWPADDVALRVAKTMWAQDDAQRDRFLRDAAEIDWWISGDDAPKRPAK
jgi:NAD(P)-dependent dehydrogenase (short-subunit alcohol dehydrogenase family)